MLGTLAGDGGRLSVFAAGSFCGAGLLAALIFQGLPEAVLAGALGCVLYVACLQLAVPGLTRTLIAAVRPKSGAAQPSGAPASSSISAR